MQGAEYSRGMVPSRRETQGEHAECMTVQCANCKKYCRRRLTGLIKCRVLSPFELKVRRERAQRAWLANDPVNSGKDPAQAPLGLKWQEIGSTKPKAGTEIHNQALAAALQKRVDFSKTEWDSFKISNLSQLCFIKVGDKFFQPVVDKFACGQDPALFVCEPQELRINAAWNIGNVRWNEVTRAHSTSVSPRRTGEPLEPVLQPSERD